MFGCVFIYFFFFLQDAELESIQMQNGIEGLNEEKERLLNALVEAEYVFCK